MNPVPAVSINFKKYPLPRVRHHTSPNLYIPLQDFPQPPVYYPPVPESLDWGQVYPLQADSPQPSVLDLGCGRGSFLYRYAHAFPEKLILGIEVRKALADYINSVLTAERIANAAALWYSAVNGLHFIASGSIDTAFYFFPDPWPKRYHHKRRLFSFKFLDEVHRVLSPEGALYLMTDVPEVEQYQLGLIGQHGKFRAEVPGSDEMWFLPRTDQEDFCIKKKIPYFRHICRKVT